MNKSHVTSRRDVWIETYLFLFINNPDKYLFGHKHYIRQYYSVCVSNTRIINMFILINKTGIFLLRYKQHFLSYYSAFLNATKTVSLEKIINMFRNYYVQKNYRYSREALKYSV